MNDRGIAEISYNEGAPSEVATFEELAELQQVVKHGPDWNTIHQIVVTLNRSSVAAQITAALDRSSPADAPGPSCAGG